MRNGSNVDRPLQQLVKVVKWLGAAVLVLALSWLLWSVLQLQSSNNDLIGVLAKRAPTNDYIHALAQETDCKDVIRDAQTRDQTVFLRHIADLINATQGSPDTAQLRNEVRHDSAQLDIDQNLLAHISDICKAPKQPVFDSNGALVGDPPMGPPLPTVPVAPPTS